MATAVAVFVLTLLFLGALVSTTEITRGGEIYFLRDSIIKNLLFVLFIIILFVLCIYITKKNSKTSNIILEIEKSNELYLRIRKFILMALFGVGLVWILAAKVGGRADDRVIQEITFAANLGDFREFEAGGYINRYPNQLGYLALSFVFSKVFGNFNYFALQIVNVIAMTLFYKYMTDILESFKISRITRLLYLLTGFLFFPLIMYCAFAYGTVLGLCFSALAIKLELNYFDTKKVLFAICSAISMALAFFFKNNYMIFGIGMIITALVFAIKRLDKKVLIYLLGLILCMGCCFLVPKAFHLYGQSSWIWVAMGMQEGTYGPGWYEKFCDDLYEIAPANPDLQAAEAKKIIKEYGEKYISNPKEAISFYTRKNASQWNCPTFQGFFVNTYENAGNVRSDLLYKLISSEGEFWALRILNLLQFACLAGAMLFFFTEWGKEQYIRMLVFPTIFVGGFIFHTVWEAKSLYTLPYFSVIIPISIIGYAEFCGYIADKLTAGKEAVSVKKKRAFLVGSLSISLIIVLVLYGYSGVACITSDNDTYEEYLANSTYHTFLKEGVYQFTTKDGNAISLDGNSNIKVSVLAGKTYLYVENMGYLTWDRDFSSGKYTVYVSKLLTYDNHQEWYSQEGPDETVCLYNEDGMYLLFNEQGNLDIDIFTYDDSKTWKY